jgi:hypothetical protein
MADKLCKLVKSGYLDDHLKDYIKRVNSPTVVCKRCGRSANNEKDVCKPKVTKKSREK